MNSYQHGAELQKVLSGSYHSDSVIGNAKIYVQTEQQFEAIEKMLRGTPISFDERMAMQDLVIYMQTQAA